jgi:hypothetical protein
VLNVFYTTGDMHDPGWLASITWHNGWHLYGPQAFSGPYFSEHLAPILWLTNAASFVIPLTKFDYYAALIAAIHALYAAGVYRAWQLGETRVTAMRAGVAVLVALTATFSAVAVIALRLPHPELAIPALGLWFLIAMAQRAHGWAACWLAACLMVREDAGFHLAGLLVLWAGVLAWRRQRGGQDSGWRYVRWLMAFALAAFGYSVAAFLAKHVYFPFGDILTRSYLGDPPWHHVTVPFVLDRLHFYLVQRTYVTLPLLITLLWGAVVRNPLLPLGSIAALPWLGLNILAVHETPGTLGYYYGFPFWLSLAWPLIALHVWREVGGRAARRWPYALLLLVSIVGWQVDRVTVYPLETDPFGNSRLAYTDTVRDRARNQDFVDYYLANRPLFGVTALDQGVFGLLVDHADRSAWLELWPADQPPETMIYFVGGLDYRPRVTPLLRTGIYRCVYGVPGTHIQIATRNPLSDLLPVPMPIMLVSASPGAQC